LLTKSNLNQSIYKMKSRIALIFILVITAISPLIIHNSSHGWGGDFALYLDQASALWEGNIRELLEQNTFGLQHSSYSYYSPELYPWGWPILLSPMVKLVGLNYTWLKLVVMLFFIAMLLASYYLFRIKTGATGSLLIVACLSFNPGLIEYTNNLRSAFPFLFFVMMALWSYEKLRHSKGTSWRRIVLAAFLFFYASIIRSEGFLLVAAVGTAEFIQWGAQKFSKKYLLDRKWLPKMAVAFVCFHIGYTLLLPGGSSSHFSHFELTSEATIIGNINFYLDHLDYCFSSYLKKSFVMVVLPFVVIGLYTRFREDMAMSIYFVLLHVLFVVWPHHEIRYLFILIPFYFYFLFQGLQKTSFSIQLKNWIFPSSRIAFSAFLVIMLLDYSFYLMRKINRPEYIEGPETEDAREMFAFINMQTQNCVIVFFKPRVMSLYTGHRSCIIHDYPENIRPTGNYVVLHKQMGDYNQINSLIDHPPAWLSKKMENSRFVVYQINREDEISDQ